MAGQRQAPVPAGRREGSRWINERPSSDDVADWFIQNAPMHAGMEAKRYVTGVTLIPAKETPKILSDGKVIDGPEQLVYTPYVKIETRIAYFWDLMELREWVGEIEPVSVPRRNEQGYFNEHLPPGFFRFPVKKQDGKVVDFVACSQRVRVYVPDARAGGKGKLRMAPPAGTKIAAMLNRWGEDQNSLMKAETGSIGRALGMAGMLVIPGSGVATAEDVQESNAHTSGAVDPSLPDVGTPERDVADGLAAAAPDQKQRAEELLKQLESHPKQLEEVQEWARGRKLSLNELAPEHPALRGVVRQLEKALEAGEAEKKAQGGD